MTKFHFLIAFLSMIFLSACTNDQTMTSTLDCGTLKPTYTNDIAAIMNASCALGGCHSASSSSAGFNLSNYTGTKNGGSQSIFLRAIKHESGAKAMPENASKLSTTSINKIECWINNGSPE